MELDDAKLVDGAGAIVASLLPEGKSAPLVWGESIAPRCPDGSCRSGRAIVGYMVLANVDVHLSLVPQSRLAGSPRQKPLYSDQVLRAKEKQAQLASVWSGSRPMTQEEALLE
eukprot:scaffold248125_cov30-Tisochrysis_lutea.AAC.2